MRRSRLCSILVGEWKETMEDVAPPVARASDSTASRDGVGLDGGERGMHAAALECSHACLLRSMSRVRLI